MLPKAKPVWLRPFAAALALCFVLALGLSGPVVAQTSSDRADPDPEGPPIGILGEGDLREAIGSFARLAAFYGAIAEQDSNPFARDRWSGLQGNYRGIARQLGDLLDSGRLRVVDLPAGALRVSPQGGIDLDAQLGGRWVPSLLQFYATRGISETRQSDLLLPVLIQALAQLNGEGPWPWFDDHVKRAGILRPLANDAIGRAELSRYFFLKDRYLTLSMRRIAERDPTLRQDWARRQMRAFTEVRGLRRSFADRLGAGPADRLRRDWSEYVALVDGFAITRGWLMLDPTLRLTQMRRPLTPGTVARAAEEIRSQQVTSIMTPRAGQRAPGLLQEPEDSGPAPSGPSLASLLRQSKAAATEQALADEVSASLPLQALLLAPQLRASPSQTAEFRAFATRLKEAMAQPDPRLEIAKRDEALAVAEQRLAVLAARVSQLEPVEEEVSLLQQRVSQLDAAEQEVALLQEQVLELDKANLEVAALQRRVEELKATEREVAELQERVQTLDEAEQEVAALQIQVEELDRAAQEVAVLEERVRELSAAEEEVAILQERVQRLDAAEQQVEALEQQVGELDDAQQKVAKLQAQVEELGTALSERQEQTFVLEEQLAEARRDPASAIAPAVSRIEERQLYMMAAIAVMFLLTLALWLWRRAQPVVVYEHAPAAARVMPPPKLLKSPPTDRSPLAEPASPPEVIEVPPSNLEVAEDQKGPGADGTEAPTGAAWHENDDEMAHDAVLSNGHDAVSPDHEVESVGTTTELHPAATAVQEAALGDEESAASHPIVRALRRDNLPLFELLFSELTDLRSPQLQRIVYGGGGEDLAIVCRAVGVDKLLFGAIFILTDHLRGGEADDDPERIEAILDMYDRTAPETARKVLAKWQRNWGAEVPTDSSLVD